MMIDELVGILPVLPTPFTAEGGVDLAAMRRLVGFALRSGVNGVVFPGFASEVEALTTSERKELLAVVVREIGGRLPIVAGASATTQEEVVGHGRVALGMGIRYLMVQPPKAIGADSVSVTAFMKGIADALPDVRLILQNAPAPRGSDLAPETIVAVARAVPQVVYIKEETLPAGPAISHILGDRPASLAGVIGGGGARYILDEYERGACAAMPAIELADQHAALDTAWRSGDKAQARSIYVRTLPLLTLQAVYRMRLTKHVMMRRGVLANGIVRAPTPELDPVAIADIDRNLAELGLLSVDSSDERAQA